MSDWEDSEEPAWLGAQEQKPCQEPPEDEEEIAVPTAKNSAQASSRTEGCEVVGKRAEGASSRPTQKLISMPKPKISANKSYFDNNEMEYKEEEEEEKEIVEAKVQKKKRNRQLKTLASKTGDTSVVKKSKNAHPKAVVVVTAEDKPATPSVSSSVALAKSKLKKEQTLAKLKWSPSTDGRSIEGMFLTQELAESLTLSILVHSPANLLSLLATVKRIKTGEFTACAVVSEGPFAYTRVVPHALSFFDDRFSGLVVQEESESRTHLLIARLAATVYINPSVTDMSELQFQVQCSHLEAVVTSSKGSLDAIRLDFTGELLRVVRISSTTGKVSRFSSMPTQIIMHAMADTISNADHAWHIIVPMPTMRSIMDTAARAEFKVIRLVILRNILSGVKTLFFQMSQAQLYDELPLELSPVAGNNKTYTIKSSAAVLFADPEPKNPIRSSKKTDSVKEFDTYLSVEQFKDSTRDDSAPAVNLYLQDGCTVITHLDCRVRGFEVAYNVAYLDDAAREPCGDIFYSLL